MMMPEVTSRPSTTAERRDASRAVLRRARSLEDLRLLLDALGLSQGPEIGARCPQCARTIEDCRCTPHGPRGGGGRG